MLHACFTPNYICFVYTSFHLFTFSGTNLLKRCHRASSLFSGVLYFRKVLQEIFSELDEIKAEDLIFRSKDEVQRGDEEAPQGGQIRPRCGPGPGRA
jgi:hypothetical protein